MRRGDLDARGARYGFTTRMAPRAGEIVSDAAPRG